MNGIIKKIYRKKDIDNIQKKINMLGTNSKIKFDAITFLNTRIITTILFTIILIILESSKYYLIPFLVIIYYNTINDA